MSSSYYVIMFRDKNYSHNWQYWGGRNPVWSLVLARAHKYRTFQLAHRAHERGKNRERNPYDQYKFKHAEIQEVED